MPLPERAGPAPGRLEASAVAPFVDAMAAHEVRLLAGLEASALADLWPCFSDGEDFSQMRDDPLSRTHLPLRLAALAARRPALSRAEGVQQ